MVLWGNRLTGESGFVDIHRHCFKQYSVGRYLFAGVEYHDVANNDLFTRHCCGDFVANHLHRLIVVDLVEQGKLAVGFLLRRKSESGGEDYGYEYAYRLEEYAGPFVEHGIFVY